MKTWNALSSINNLKTTWILLSFALSLPGTVQSAENIAFNTLNLNPMIQIFGLPSLTNPVANAQGTVKIEIEQQAANFHSRSTMGNETITLDGEAWRTNLNITYALTESAFFSVSAPYIRHSSGYMDDLIYNWHDMFGLPQGERTKNTNNNIDIQYSQNGKKLIDIGAPVSGIGDIRLKYSHMFPAFKRKLFLQSEVKLPTGDVDLLTGSGGTDLSLGFILNDALTFKQQNINTWVGGAATYLGKIDGDLSEHQKKWVGSARAGLGWSLNETISLKTQLDTHTVAYDSNTNELGNAALMLTLGGDIHFSPNYRLELSAVEDLVTESSPDVIFSAKFSAKIE